MRRFFYAFSIVFSLLLWNHASAQLNLSWEEIGPNNIGNHTRAMHVSSDGTVWAGSVGGGLWKSSDNGFTWSQVAGISDNLAVSCITSSGSNIYVGTGELVFYRVENSFLPLNQFNADSAATFKKGFFNYSGMPGEGVYVSNDGGATWTHNNGTWNGSSTRYNGPFTSIQAIATNGTRTAIATKTGLYISDNADLSNVTLVSGPSQLQTRPILDVAFGANNVLYATTKDSLYRSNNAGTSFGRGINASIPTDPVPNHRVGGAGVLISVSNIDPNVAYVSGVNDANQNSTGVWKTTDNGVTWERKAPYESGNYAPFGGNGDYASILIADPTNADGFFIGGSSLYRYNEDDGLIDAASSTYIPGFSTAYVPSPQLCITFDPTNDSTMYIAGDDEIVRTMDNSQTYSFKTKGYNNASLLGISAAGNYKVMASDRFRGLVYKDNGNSGSTSQQFSTIYSSGLGIGRFSVSNFNHIIAQAGDGGVNRSLVNGEAFESFYGAPISPIHPSLGTADTLVDRPDPDTEGAGLWDDEVGPVNPWVMDEVLSPAQLADDTLTMEAPVWLYLCSAKYVWVCTNPWGTLDSLPKWNRITPAMISSSTAPKEFWTAMTVSGDNNHVVFAATNHGRLYRIYNANDPVNMDVTTKFDTLIGHGYNATMPDRWISDLEVDPNDPNNLIITYGAYNNSGNSRVYISNNALDQSNPVTFRSIGGGISPLIPVYCAAFHPNPNVNGIMVGTDMGVYSSNGDYTNSGVTLSWTNESGSMGNVPVYDLYVRPYYQHWIDNDNWRYAPDWTIFAATHGRGAFKSQSIVSVPDVVERDVLNINLYPNPSSTNAFVEFDLETQADVIVEVFGLDGRKVMTLANGSMSAGNHKLQLPSSRLNAGVYLVNAKIRTKSGEFTKTMKAIVAK